MSASPSSFGAVVELLFRLAIANLPMVLNKLQAQRPKLGVAIFAINNNPMQISHSPINQSMSNPSSMSGTSEQPGPGLLGLAHRGIGLSNTIHSEVVQCFPLPSLPVFCGASDPELRLFDGQAGGALRSLNRPEIIAQASLIADLLRETDVSYLNLRDEASLVTYDYVEPLELHAQVLQYNPAAFEYVTPGEIEEEVVQRNWMEWVGRKS
ncbi:hypothetical protein CRYUN_Cryun17cG0041600 [Craigia yunnanensis]